LLPHFYRLEETGNLEGIEKEGEGEREGRREGKREGRREGGRYRRTGEAR